MKQLACPQASSHKGVTTGLPSAIASSMFLVRTNLSATKCEASDIEAATDTPNLAKIYKAKTSNKKANVNKFL